jgi:hypothetical protein
MLEINSYDEPNLLIADGSERSFNIITIATQDTRHYRIVKETEFGFFNYDFTYNLSLLPNGTICVINVPYIPIKFINANSGLPIPEVLNPNLQGSVIDSGIYKLLYISREEDKEIPAKILLNEVYRILDEAVVFIYFRVIDSIIYYTGYFGNQFLENQSIPDLNINAQNLFDQKIHDGKKYYFIKLNSTPNIYISNNKTDSTTPNVTTETSVSPSGYTVYLELPGNSLLNNKFQVSAKFYMNGNAVTTFTSLSQFELITTNSGLNLINVTRGLDVEKYIFTVSMSGEDENVDFNIYPKTIL